MSITSDLNVALANAIRARGGEGGIPMRWRMGPSALKALAAENGNAAATRRYQEIPIEAVEAPSGGGTEPSRDRFLGWELVA